MKRPHFIVIRQIKTNVMNANSKQPVGDIPSSRSIDLGSVQLAPGLIPAYKEGWPCRAVDALIRRQMREGLFRVRVQGLDSLRDALREDDAGFLFLANHSCWWDLYLAHFLNETVPVDGYGMMEHVNLNRYRFFRRIGAFSVDPTAPWTVRTSMLYTIALLSQPGTGVWFFPQGDILSNDLRPLRFKNGLRALLRLAGRLRAVPVAIRFDFWQDQRPEAFVRFGLPEYIERDEVPTVIPTWEAKITALLDQLKTDVIAQDESAFRTLLEGQLSISIWFDKLRERLPFLNPS